ncbi:PREDICTED: uncharacterized protein LOC109342316 [Lupinus angustifolius]|uniref:uncharacterized protein LOC109342316 n=1 Tax=Lupinus angustifolius TaxID=3871 RepID=UPI00092EAEE0|nr:PREDICTED: uncharacterized protein LOC109342316 [Lupinus angustifolius]
MGLLLKYWSAKILFSIAGGIGTPISLDEAPSNISFGQFARVLVDVDLKSSLPNQILVEREGFAFFVTTEFKNLPDFCTGRHSIGHMVVVRRKNKLVIMEENLKLVNKKVNHVAKKSIEKMVDNLVVNLEIDHSENMKLLEWVALPQVAGTVSLTGIDELPIVESLVVQPQEQIANPIAAKDLRIVGRLWADDSDSEADIAEECNFTPCYVQTNAEDLTHLIEWRVRTSYPSLRRLTSPIFPLDEPNSPGLTRGEELPTLRNGWIEPYGLKSLVETSWNSRVVGCPMFMLSQKLKNLKVCLRSWNKEVFWNIHLRLKMALEEIDSIQQRRSLVDNDQGLMDEESLAQQELLMALRIEEEFWREKARVNWHTSGDRNTTYFHKLAKIRQVTNSLTLLTDGENNIWDPVKIANHAVSYLKTLYASKNQSQPNELIQLVIPNMVTDSDNCMLTKIPSHNEIKAAVFAMKGEGAPGLDGFGGCFYQEFWEIVGVDVCNSVSQFFTQSWILPNLNSNSVVLLPKFPRADKIEDFRPIALANFQFKVISKVLADRLVVVAPSIVSNQQKRFRKGGQVTECICIASEAVNLLDHKTFGGNLAIKLDVRKAFGTIDWGFLLDILHAFVFDSKFIHWIKVILTSAKLSIVLRMSLAEGKLSAISGRRNISTPSHVMYADDIIIFCKGLKREILALNKLIYSYAQASGQHINLVNPLAYRIITKLSKWKGSSLSIMGRVELVKSIIHNILGYSFHVYAWPTTLLKSVDQSIRNFILSGDSKEWASFYRLRFYRAGELKASYVKSSVWPGIKFFWQMIIGNSIWLLGNGSKIIFWFDNWLGEPLVDTLSIPPQIHSTLAATINLDKSDELVWKHSSDGRLSLKTAYSFFNSRVSQLSWCNLIWSISIPPTKSFNTWRLVNNKIPVDENLQKRGIPLASVYTLCHAAVETSLHLFLHCSYAFPLWNWLETLIGKHIDRSFFAALLQLPSNTWSHQLTEVVITYIISTISTIWHCRNHDRFEDKSISTAQALARIQRDTAMIGNFSKSTTNPSLEEFMMLRAFRVHPKYTMAPIIMEVRWLLPNPGWVKINTDGAAHSSPGHARGGGIFRDCFGEMLGCFAIYMNIQDSLYAELFASILAIAMAKWKGWSVVWLECDSSMVVDIFKGKFQVPWKLRNSWSKCCRILNVLNFRVYHIYREGNTCVDKLASFRVNSMVNSWWNSTPSFLLHEYNRNRLLLPNYSFKHM